MLPADSSFTPELIAACAHSTRAGGRFYSQAQRLEDAVHARLLGAKGDIAANVLGILALTMLLSVRSVPADVQH